MNFELAVAVKRDPLDGRNAGHSPTQCPATYTAIALNGRFDAAASQATLRTVRDLFVKGVESILVDMESVDVGDPVCLHGFAEGLMSLRDAGANVQVAVRQATLHTEMCRMPHSRDWLLSFTQANVAGPRKAIHLDRLDGKGRP